jgi:hypothetical protein
MVFHTKGTRNAETTDVGAARSPTAGSAVGATGGSAEDQAPFVSFVSFVSFVLKAFHGAEESS